jgi:hypothetical protein
MTTVSMARGMPTCEANPHLMLMYLQCPCWRLGVDLPRRLVYLPHAPRFHRAIPSARPFGVRSTTRTIILQDDTLGIQAHGKC